jgi:hypothetical protein
MSRSLSPEDREYLRRSRQASGVPEKVTDMATIERLVGSVRNSSSRFPPQRSEEREAVRHSG